MLFLLPADFTSTTGLGARRALFLTAALSRLPVSFILILRAKLMAGRRKESFLAGCPSASGPCSIRSQIETLTWTQGDARVGLYNPIIGAGSPPALHLPRKHTPSLLSWFLTGCVV